MALIAMFSSRRLLLVFLVLGVTSVFSQSLTFSSNSGICETTPDVYQASGFINLDEESDTEPVTPKKRGHQEHTDLLSHEAKAQQQGPFRSQLQARSHLPFPVQAVSSRKSSASYIHVPQDDDGDEYMDEPDYETLREHQVPRFHIPPIAPLTFPTTPEERKKPGYDDKVKASYAAKASRPHSNPFQRLQGAENMDAQRFYIPGLSSGTNETPSPSHATPPVDPNAPRIIPRPEEGYHEPQIDPFSLYHNQDQGQLRDMLSLTGNVTLVQVLGRPYTQDTGAQVNAIQAITEAVLEEPLPHIQIAPPIATGPISRPFGPPLFYIMIGLSDAHSAILYEKGGVVLTENLENPHYKDPNNIIPRHVFTVAGLTYKPEDHDTVLQMVKAGSRAIREVAYHISLTHEGERTDAGNQRAVEAFYDSMEVIPMHMAEKEGKPGSYNWAVYPFSKDPEAHQVLRALHSELKFKGRLGIGGVGRLIPDNWCTQCRGRDHPTELCPIALADGFVNHGKPKPTPQRANPFMPNRGGAPAKRGGRKEGPSPWM